MQADFSSGARTTMMVGASYEPHVISRLEEKIENLSAQVTSIKKKMDMEKEGEREMASYFVG